MSTADKIRRRRARMVTWLDERAGVLPLPSGFGSMSRHDRDRWASARTWTDLGERVIEWLDGKIVQTPGHCGCPDPETTALIPALTVINRYSGFVTDCSQQAETYRGDAWNTWVEGFATDAVLAGLRRAIAGTPLRLAACQGRGHRNRDRRCEHQQESPGWRACPLPDCADFWAERCPHMAREIKAAWYVTILDPEPGRNDVLWPTLERFAGVRS